MSHDAPTTQRTLATDADLVIREARRRQRRRRLVAGLVLAVMLAGAAGVAAGLTPGGQPPASRPRPEASTPAPEHQAPPGPIPRSVGTTLLMWPVGYPLFGPNFGPPAYLDDLVTRHLSRRHQPAFAAGDFRPYLVQAGHWLVYVGGSGAMVSRDSLKGRQRVLGRTPFLAPAASPGQVWLERIDGDLGVGGRASVWRVAVRTGHRGPVIDLPRNSGLVAGTDAGLLLEVLRDHDFSLALWRPGGAPRLLPYSPRSGYGLDVSPRLVAYGTGCRDHDTVDNAYYPACPVLRVYDVVTGRVLSFRAPPGTAGWMPLRIGLTHAIAPGDRMIAAYAATLPLGKGRDRLYLMRLDGTGGSPRAVPSSAAVLFPRTAWSAGGSWLFYQGPRGRLWAYQVNTGRVRASGTPCCGYTVMAAFPSGRR